MTNPWEAESRACPQCGGKGWWPTIRSGGVESRDLNYCVPCSGTGHVVNQPHFAFVGSRRGVHAHVVRSHVMQTVQGYSLIGTVVTVVSGGATGVDLWAEDSARMLLARVVSYRPVYGEVEKRGKGWQVHRYVFEPGERDPDIQKLNVGPFGMYATLGQCAYARNTLIAQSVTVEAAMLAFQHEESRGTGHAVSEAQRLGRSLVVYDGKGVEQRRWP